MLWKLLRKNISPSQIAGYAIANLIGLAIVLAAVLFYRDTSAALGRGADGQETDRIVSNDYLVLSRPVSLRNTLGAKSGIRPSEIADLASQPWAESVGAFTAANFPVSGAVEFQGGAMSSYLFLEAIPDRFIDIAPSGWYFNPEEGTSAEIPIILSKDYLALYNFGFASTRGLPQLSEGVISSVPLTLYMRGNGHHEAFNARIVGFSNRLNTIAVPQDFIEWANARYSTGESPDPSRLIVEVNNPGDPEIDRYIKQHGYEVAGDKLDNSRAAFFLKLITGIVATIGGIISLLALFILLLSISLLLQKNADKVALLSLLGYTRGRIAACYIRLVAIVNAVVLVLASLCALAGARVWRPALAQIGIEPSSAMPALLLGLALMGVITLINIITIRRLVRRSAR